MKFLKHNGSHNHLKKKFEATKSLVKAKIKDRIDNSSGPFDENIKRSFDYICKGTGCI